MGKGDWLLLKKMILEHGWEVGGHTRLHKPLILLPEKKAREEIIGNIKDIEENLSKVGLTYKVTSFAYPCGDHNPAIKEILRKCGITFGLTYPDAPDYKSIKDLKEVNESSLLSFGVTHTGKPVNLNLWNQRFMESNLYIFAALHPDPFML